MSTTTNVEMDLPFMVGVVSVRQPEKKKGKPTQGFKSVLMYVF